MSKILTPITLNEFVTQIYQNGERDFKKCRITSDGDEDLITLSQQYINGPENFQDHKALNISGSYFMDLMIPHINFTNADAKGVVFNHSNLRNAVFNNADFTGAQFINGCSLEHAYFLDTIIDKAKFSKANLYHAFMKGTIGNETEFKNSYINNISTNQDTIFNYAIFLNNTPRIIK